MSLGRCFAGHSLPHKLDMAAKYGFSGIEVFYEELVALTDPMPGGATSANQLVAANMIRQLCDARGLTIICLQPFMHYGGLIDRELHHQRVGEMYLWVRLAHTLGTDLILLPSSFLPKERVSADVNVVVEDMIEIAEIGLRASPVVRFAYEALCWGTRVDTWEASWEVVQRVDRSNFGICLDSFNIAGRVYADPAVSSGRTENCEQAVIKSMDTLVSSVDVRKVFLLQVADAERLQQPLDQAHSFYSADQPSRMSWSRNARLFYGESQHGGYLPVKTILDAIANGLGFQGWLSFEVFNRKLAETEEGVPEEMARRASQSWTKMKRDLSLRVEEPQARMQAML